MTRKYKKYRKKTVPAGLNKLGCLSRCSQLRGEVSSSIEVQPILQQNVGFLDVGKGHADDAVGFLGHHAGDHLAVNVGERTGGSLLEGLRG